MSAERDQRYLGEGIAEELLNALTSIAGLSVAARTSSFSFEGKNATVREIGDVLQVRHVLEGSVRRSGQKLRVTAQLVDVESGFHLFSQIYDRQVKDVFEIQNDLAREIATALMPKLGLKKDAKLIRPSTLNIEAYNLRLKARQWLMAPDPRTQQDAIAQLERATSLDPYYSEAWGDLAYARSFTSTWVAKPVPHLVDASNAAVIALFLAPNNVSALLTQAYVEMLVNHDKGCAASYYDRAQVVEGDFGFFAFDKAYLYDGPLGRYEEAIASLKEAARKDPLAAGLKHALIEMYLGSGKVKEAIETAEEILKLGWQGPDAALNAARAFLAAGDLHRARESFETTKATEDFLHRRMVELALCAATGEYAKAQNLLDHLLKRDAEGYDVSAFLIGEAYRTIGDYDQMFKWWTLAVERYEDYTLAIMPIRNRNDPIIGRDPQFLAMLKSMGLEAEGKQGGNIVIEAPIPQPS